MSDSDATDRPPRASVEARRRLQRLEELRRDLCQEKQARREYALNALLALLWVSEGRERLATACALCGRPPDAGKGETRLFAGRLCTALASRDRGAAPGSELDLAPPPGPRELEDWLGDAVAAVLQGSLDQLKAAIRAPGGPEAGIMRREAEVCQDGLFLASMLRCAALVAPCMRLLRILPPDLARDAGILAHETAALRSQAARALAGMSPDFLYLFWVDLRSPDVRVRRDLLCVLDYVTDAAALPYLTRLLESRVHWPDAEMVGWAVVRAFERIGDRAALPALRRIGSSGAAYRVSATRTHTSPALALEARRVIRAMETWREGRERDVLLRPSASSEAQLLRPAEDAEDEEPAELLRSTEPPAEDED
jgi:hypothetical protein